MYALNMMWVFRFALQVLVIFLVSPSSIIVFKLIDSVVQAFILPDAATSPFKQPQRNHRYYRADATVNTAEGTVSRWASPSFRNQDRNNDNQIEGLLVSEEEFGRLVAVDETIRALQLQLPTILTKALTPAMVEKVYSKDDFCFSVLVDDERGNSGGGNSGIIDQDNVDGGDDRDNVGANTKKDDDEIVILNSREELMALSDVLVLTTAAAQQAILVTGRSADANVKIECQFIIDGSCRIVRIPWRAKTPTLGTLSPTGSGNNRYNNFEGITDCYLSDDDVRKVERFVVRKASFNGRILNGPAIGQALKRIQSTLSNLQQNPILQNIVRTTTQQSSDDNNNSNNNNNRATNIFNTLRDEFLDQAATALSSTSQTASSKENVDATTIPVYQVDYICDLSLVTNNGWIQHDQIDTADNAKPKQKKIFTPCPGTKDWDNYVDSRSCLTRFSNDVIPQLSDLSIVDAKLFADDATYQIEADESIVMTGRESLANFFQSMALTRKGTGGSWTMIRYEVLDWKARTVAISYEVTTSSLPLWTIQGRDIYELDTTTSKDDRPIIKSIRQGKMMANGPNGNALRLDGRWLTENMASAFQGGDGTSRSSKLPRDFLTELLMNQPSLSPLLKQQKSSTRSKSSTESTRRKLSKSAAAATYYIMSDLYEEAISLFDMASSNRRSPPGAEQMSENIELKGYLGESIVRGSSLYNRSIGSVIFGIRESIRQKRLVIEGTPAPPRVELLVPTGEIRLSLTFSFRIPPIGAGILPPQKDSSNSLAPGLPLKVELTSDYRIDPDTGLITEHRLVETRINGQLTAGDQVSRWMQRFLKLDVAAATTTVRNEDGGLTAIMDAISWFRSM